MMFTYWKIPYELTLCDPPSSDLCKTIPEKLSDAKTNK